MNKSTSIIAFFLPMFMLFLCSCDKDVEGCMNPNAENFNPDATIDIGQCSFARDKFVGTYTGTLSCEAPLPNSDDFDFTITEDSDAEQNIQINFQNENFDIPSLNGTVNGNNVDIDSVKANIALDPSNPVVTTEFIYFGEATISEDETMINGTLSVFVVSFNTTLSCDLEGIKN